MYKKIEDKRKWEKEYYKKYRKAICERKRISQKIWRNINKKRLLIRNRIYRAQNPWMKTLFSVYKRVRGKESKERYFDRGICNFLTVENIKSLWYRDEANKMKKPTLHRLDNDGDYEMENCIYMEFSDHIKFHKACKKQERNLRLWKSVSHGIGD